MFIIFAFHTPNCFKKSISNIQFSLIIEIYELTKRLNQASKTVNKLYHSIKHYYKSIM